MDKLKFLVTGAFVGAAILVVGFFFGQNLNSVPRAGGVVIHNVSESFDAGLEVNGTTAIDSSRGGSFVTMTATGETRLFAPRHTGSVLNVASSSVTTLTAAQVCDNAVITQPDWTGIASGTAIMNLPSAATLYSDCLTTNGDSFQFLFRNLHATAGSSTAVVAGASTTLVGVDSNADIINGANEAWVRLIRYSATELVGIITEVTAAD